MLNSMKFYYIAFLAFAKTPEDDYQVCVAIILIVAISSVPMILANFLYKNRDKLESEEIILKYGTLYEGKKVNAGT